MVLAAWFALLLCAFGILSLVSLLFFEWVVQGGFWCLWDVFAIAFMHWMYRYLLFLRFHSYWSLLGKAFGCAILLQALAGCTACGFHQHESVCFPSLSWPTKHSGQTTPIWNEYGTTKMLPWLAIKLPWTTGIMTLKPQQTFTNAS